MILEDSLIKFIEKTYFWRPPLLGHHLAWSWTMLKFLKNQDPPLRTFSSLILW